MKNNELIKIKAFGSRRKAEIVLLGDSIDRASELDENGEYKIVDLLPEEEALVKWIQTVDFTELAENITRYINYNLSMIEADNITKSELKKESMFEPAEILVNVEEDSEDDDTAEIALFAECELLEDGILIGFKDKEYFGISEYTETLDYFDFQ